MLADRRALLFHAGAAQGKAQLLVGGSVGEDGVEEAARREHAALDQAEVRLVLLRERLELLRQDLRVADRVLSVLVDPGVQAKAQFLAKN